MSKHNSGIMMQKYSVCVVIDKHISNQIIMHSWCSEVLHQIDGIKVIVCSGRQGGKAGMGTCRHDWAADQAA